MCTWLYQLCLVPLVRRLLLQLPRGPLACVALPGTILSIEYKRAHHKPLGGMIRRGAHVVTQAALVVGRFVAVVAGVVHGVQGLIDVAIA